MMAPNGQPIFIMQEGTEQKRGRNAQSNNISAAKAVGDAVRSTLGPKGMDKMLVDNTGQVVVTNDGATILREIGIEHPAAKMVVAVAQTQESRCYDGTTSAVVLASELLRRAEGLLEKGIHPSTICSGFQIGLHAALGVVDEVSAKTKDAINSAPMLHIASTSLTGKSAESSRDLLATLCVDAVNTAGNLEDIRILTLTGGSVEDTWLFEGVAVEKDKAHPRLPDLSEGRVAILSCALEAKKGAMEAQVQITNPDQVAAFLEEEERAIKDMVQRLVDLQVSAVFVQKGVDDLAIHYLRRNNILVVEKVVRSDLDALCKATGSSMVSDLADLKEEDMGLAICRVNTDFDNPFITVVRCHKATGVHTPVSIITMGSTPHVAAEIERALDDALGVLWLTQQKDEYTVGGGATHVEIYKKLNEVSQGISNRTAMAISEFGEAMLAIPQTIGENAGLDPVDVALDLIAQHNAGGWEEAIRIPLDGEVGGPPTVDAIATRLVEPKEVVVQALKSATEAAIMILRIDDVIMMKADNPSPMQGMG